MRHPIRHNCGLEAWQVIFRVLKDTTKTLMPACQFTGTSTKIAHNRHHSKVAKGEVAGNAPRPPPVDPRKKPELPDVHMANLGIPESVSYNAEMNANPAIIGKNNNLDSVADEADIIVVTEERAQFSELEGKPESIPSNTAAAFAHLFSLFSFILFFLITF